MHKDIIYKEEFQSPILLGRIYENEAIRGNFIVLANLSRSMSETLDCIANSNTALLKIDGEQCNYKEFKKIVDSCSAIFRSESDYFKFLSKSGK